VISGDWAGGDAGGCSRWRCGGGDSETQWQQRHFFSTVQRHRSAFPSPPVYPFCSFSSFSPFVSLSFLVDIPCFCVSQFRSFLSLHSQFLSLSFPPFLLFFSSFLLFSLLRSGGIYRGRGSRVDPTPSHRRPCMGCTSPALPRRRQWWPMEASLVGHGCSGISSWDGWCLTLALKHVGGRDKGKKIKLFFPCCTSRGGRRRNNTALKRHRFVLFFSNAWNIVVLLKTRRFI